MCLRTTPPCYKPHVCTVVRTYPNPPRHYARASSPVLPLRVFIAVLRPDRRADAPRLLRTLIAELLADFPIPEEATAAAIAKAVALLPIENIVSSSVPAIDNLDKATIFSVEKGLSLRSSSTLVGRCKVTPASPMEMKGVRLAAVEENGSCSCCGAILKLIRLTESQRAAVRTELLMRSAPRNPQKQHHLISFSQWLRNRAPFDYVLDGPNIAYAKQNFEGGKFRFEHLDSMVRYLQDRHKRVLIMLPNKYVTGSQIPNHTSSSERSSKISDADRRLIAGWQQQEILYRCASQLYDDWFWMYASVAEDAEAPTNVVVTNDAMRDHWNELLPQRDFVRWRTSQIVGFDVHYGSASGIKGDGESVLGVEVEELPLFSIEAQLVNRRWHVPIIGSEPQQWLCIPEILDRRARGRGTETR